MAIKKIKCLDCKKTFDFDTNSRYKRKYCDNCSKKRKEDYENLYLVKSEDCEDCDD